MLPTAPTCVSVGGHWAVVLTRNAMSIIEFSVQVTMFSSGFFPK
jgi:hypothetical protein